MICKHVTEEFELSRMQSSEVNKGMQWKWKISSLLDSVDEEIVLDSPAAVTDWVA
jgi:hypothetical protein